MSLASAVAAEDAPPSISIATGIIVALAASFVQSLGLTIQRKSHLQNEALPQMQQRRDWKRPLWLMGFAIFITSNILGSVFQIGALPIVILAPLGAVSLLWNALFAKFLLGDIFSRYLIIGTILIAGGAVLIAIFGVVPETTHTLEELLHLYSRPAFIVWISLLTAAIVLILGLAHWREASLEHKLSSLYIALPMSDTEDTDDADDADDHELLSHNGRRRPIVKRPSKLRRWSTPPAYLAINSETSQDLDPHPPKLDNARPLPDIRTDVAAMPQISVQGAGDRSPRRVTFGNNSYRSARRGGNTSGRGLDGSAATFGKLKERESSIRPTLPQDKVEQIRLWLGVAYGSASGTLSGLCLLFAKTGVELLILTVVGHNQFRKWQSWMIVLALLVCALLQLWYLNKSLRLVGPTLICPLAFCFYNLSSIFNGLVYYDQWSQLTPLQDGLMVLGIAVLLAGVWIVSIKSAADDEDEELSLLDATEDYSDLEAGAGEPYTPIEQDMHADEETYTDLKSRIANLYQAFLLDQAGPPRGFSVGIAASSPGFAIRPSHTRRNTFAASGPMSHLASSLRHSKTRSEDSAIVDSPLQADFDHASRPSAAMNRTSSEPFATATATAAASATRDENTALLNYRHRRKRSLAGDIYVGAVNPFQEEPLLDAPPSPSSAHQPLRRSGSTSSRIEALASPTRPQRQSISRYTSLTDVVRAGD